MDRKVLLGIVALGLVVGALSFVFLKPKRGPKLSASDQAFKEGFQRDFIRGCRSEDFSSEREKFCACLASQAVSQMTFKQLRDHAFAESYIERVIVPDCISEQAGK